MGVSASRPRGRRAAPHLPHPHLPHLPHPHLPEVHLPKALRPKPSNPLLELRAPIEAALFIAANPVLQLAPRGHRRPVMVLPGFVAADRSTQLLRLVLRQLGHRPVGWGLGRNLGPRADTFEGIHRRLQEQADKAGGPVSLVGWSLGGVFARLVAQEEPELVDQVISLGSPFNIGSDEQTTLSPIWDQLESRGWFVKSRDEVALDEVPVPSTSIYSRSDGIVSWQSCHQSEHGKAENIEVRGSHCGLGHNVAAAFALADRLAQKPGKWKPFEADGLSRHLFPS